MAEKLGAQLVRKGLIQEWQLEDALKVQQEYGCRLGTNLVELEFLDLDTLAENLGQQRKYPVAKPADFESAPNELLPTVPEKLADKHLAFPLAQEGRKLKVAFAAPYEPVGLDAIQFATGLRIVPYIAPEMTIFFYLDRRYGIVRPTRYIRRPERKAPPTQPAVPPPPPSITGGNALFGSLKMGEFLAADLDTVSESPGTIPPSSNPAIAAESPVWAPTAGVEARNPAPPIGLVKPVQATVSVPAAGNPMSGVATPSPSTVRSPSLGRSNSISTGTSVAAAARVATETMPVKPAVPPAPTSDWTGTSGTVDIGAPRAGGEATPVKPRAPSGPVDRTTEKLPQANGASSVELNSSWGIAVAVAEPETGVSSLPVSSGVLPTEQSSAGGSRAAELPHTFAYLPPQGALVNSEGDSEEQIPTLDVEPEDSPEPTADLTAAPDPTADLTAAPEPEPRSFEPIPIPDAPGNGGTLSLAPTWEFVSWNSPGGEPAKVENRPMIPLPEASPTNDVPLASTLESVKWQPNAPSLQPVATFWELCAACGDQEQIAMATLEYCSKRFSTVSYWVSRFDLAMLWRGFNLGANGSRPDLLRIDMNAPSIIKAAHDRGVAIASPIPQTPMDQWIWQALMPQNGLVAVKLAYHGHTDYLCVEIGTRSMVDVQQELTEVQQIAVEAQLRLGSSIAP